MKYIIVLLFSIGLSAQEFDFECESPFDKYIDAFFEDAEEYNIERETGSILFTTNYNNEFGNFDASIISGGSSINSCEYGYRILINELHWNNIDDMDKKQLIYHELGHSILKLAHVCNRHTESNAYARVDGVLQQAPYPDIMLQIGSHCDEDIYWQAFAHGHVRQYEISEGITFEDKKTRMFEGIQQESLNCE